jgi:hypothetical protein
MSIKTFTNTSSTKQSAGRRTEAVLFDVRAGTASFVFYIPNELRVVQSEPNSLQNDGVWGVEKQKLGTWIGLRWARNLSDR